MARPKVALISRQSTVAATLKLLEAEGLDNFSLRRLALELNVNQASFYHHFEGRSDILESAARAALSRVELPRMTDDWIEWMTLVGIAYRRFLIARPYLVDIMLAGFRPRTEVESYAESRLAEAGVARQFRGPILDALESVVVGSALVAIMSRRDDRRAHPRRTSAPGPQPADTVEQLLATSLRVLLMTWLDDPEMVAIATSPLRVVPATATGRPVKPTSRAPRTARSTRPRAASGRRAAPRTNP